MTLGWGIVGTGGVANGSVAPGIARRISLALFRFVNGALAYVNAN